MSANVFIPPLAPPVPEARRRIYVVGTNTSTVHSANDRLQPLLLQQLAQRVEAYCRAQGMWRDATTPEPLFTSGLELDLGTVQPSLAGPRRPQDRVLLKDVATAFDAELKGSYGKAADSDRRVPAAGGAYDVGHGDVVIAAITTCTNTSNPSVLVAAGLVARKARARGFGPSPG